MIKNYFKIALRSFKQHKLFTLINVVGLSIGISASLVIYLIVHYDLTFDKFHKDGDRIYRVVTNYVFAGSPNYNSGVTGPLALAVKNEMTGIEISAPFQTTGGQVLIPNGSNRPTKFKDESSIIYAEQSYFNLFNYKWLAGSPKNSLNNAHQVVLSVDQAKKYYPHLSIEQVLGKEVIYDDTIKTTITGIIEPIKQNTDFIFHDFISLATLRISKNTNPDVQDWGSTSSNSQFFVKLNKGANPKTIEKQLNALLKRHHPPKPEEKGQTQAFMLQPLADMHFNDRYYNYDIPIVSTTTLYGLMTIAAFLLLLGCINFINLTTAQASQKAKEIGIRKTLGSTRGQLIGQHLSETFLVTLFAVILAVALTPVILKTFADFMPKGLKADFIHQPDVIVFLLILILLVSLLSGFYPALVLSSYKPVDVLKNQSANGKSQTRNAWMRKSLTVTQFMIAQFFIMATILVSKQIYYALHKDLGFKKEAIIYLNTPWQDKNPTNKLVFLNKVRAIPQVAMAGLGGDIPSSNGWNSRTITYKDGKKEIKTELQTKSGDETYINIYKIKLLAGRNIRLSDSISGMLINQNYAQLLGFKTPEKALGKTIEFGKQHMQIVGVIGDFHQGSLHSLIKPLAIYPDHWNFGTVHIALKPQTANSDDWKKGIASIQKAWKEIYPDSDFQNNFFDETIAKFYENEQHFSTLLSWATGLCIFISCLGLLGLAIYTTNQRTKEIGVRKVLGASVAQIVTLLSTELVWLILLAFTLTTPIAWYAMNRWMQNFADRTTISWWIFALSAVGMLVAAVFTSSFQTVKAAIANPVKSLRSE
ncbi:ABC transporter permease [Mucilaginibacter sp. BJC16-A38]|uniref:ABC transporter permease n=1 Tax=Mucilaginibacter phenanthrenivorans TaxID=1234842 RepID=UPI002157112F|nr:ABC transporter permease [Mucilaginibacter phenanthrenivorans]MCR8556862.1 ABC transporter permease [Mucilaginibacter phenanthrenivorans]